MVSRSNLDRASGSSPDPGPGGLPGTDPVRLARRELRALLFGLADILSSPPVPDRFFLIDLVHEVQAVHRAARLEEGLLSLQLRNMLRDLAVPGQFDPPYYARQLALLVPTVPT